MTDLKPICGHTCECQSVCRFEELGIPNNQPKANPSKELYSIAKLQWNDRGVGGWYARDLENRNYNVWHDSYGWHWSRDGMGTSKCNDLEDGKHQAQTHFESKLKQMLNREI